MNCAVSFLGVAKPAGKENASEWILFAIRRPIRLNLACRNLRITVVTHCKGREIDRFRRWT